MTSITSLVRHNRRYLLVAIALLLLLYVILPQFGEFRSSGHLIRHARGVWLIGGILLTGLTYAAGAATYCFLALRPLHYFEVLPVQLAAMFINRLVPAGVGAAGVNYAYLRHRGHQAAQAASVVAVNNLIGFVGHAIIVAITLNLYAGNLVLISHSRPPVVKFLTLFFIALVVIGFTIFGLIRRGRLMSLLSETSHSLASYRHKPGRLSLALLCSMGLTLLNVLSFAACAQAVGVHLTFADYVLVFTFGVGAGTATPTPGGLGGFEAGLVAGMVAYHVAVPLALSAALLYRLVSYWLPLSAGVPAFIACQRRRLFST